MANRFDVFETKKWRMDDNDNLIVDCTPTRAGIFIYHDGKGGTIRELRHPDDVFKEKSLATLDSIPYSTQDNHISLFTPGDTTGKAFGVTLNNAKRNENRADTKLKIWDDKEIKSVLDREYLELSCGYRCDYYKNDDGTLLSGTWEGQAFDTRQKNIRYNHVSRVEKARGGESCRIRLDSESAISGIEAERLDSGETQKQSNGEKMTEKTKVFQRELPLRESGKFRLDAQEFEVDEVHKPKFDQVKVREDKLFSEIGRLNTEFTKQSVKMDALEKANKSLEKVSEGSISKEKLDQEIDKRVNLYSMGEEFKIKDYRKMSASDLGKEIVKSSGLFNEDKLDSEEYVNFAIEHMQDDHIKKVIKSRENLNNSPDFKFDAGDDLNSESELEMAGA